MEKKYEVPTMKTLNETSKETGLSYAYLRKLCMNNEIVHVRAGNKYLINFEKLIEYLNNGGR